MRKTPAPLIAAVATLLCANLSSAAACDNSGGGQTKRVIDALVDLHKALSPQQLALLERPLTPGAAIQWSNLPVAIVPRAGLRLGDLDAKQTAAARQVFEATLSACGLKLFDDVRAADDFLLPLDKNAIGWDGGNYYLSVLGAPSARTPWMLQLGGHHIAYNFVLNGKRSGATPLRAPHGRCTSPPYARAPISICPTSLPT